MRAFNRSSCENLFRKRGKSFERTCKKKKKMRGKKEKKYQVNLMVSDNVKQKF